MNRPAIDISDRGVDPEQWNLITAAMPSFDISRHERLVVVVPHPVDETLGVGGLIAATSMRGASVLVIVLADAEGPSQDPPLAAIRHTELLRALDRLGVAAPVAVASWRLRGGRLAEHEREIEDRLGALVRPGDLLVAPLADDGLPDQETAGRVLATLAARDLTGRHTAGSDATASGVAFATFPLWAWHWHDPRNSVITTSGVRVALPEPAFRAKLDALQIYESQTTGDPPILPAQFVRRFEQRFEVLVPVSHSSPDRHPAR